MSVEDLAPSRPDWLDDEFVKTCVKNDVGASSIDDIDVDDIQIQYVVPKGENYSSIILRLVVKGVTVNSHNQSNGDLVNGNNGNQNGAVNDLSNEKRYIIKVPQEDIIMVTVMDDLKSFSREIDMYLNLVPRVENILKSADLETKFACRCLHVLEEKKIFVMEDLGAKNYILADRKNGADIDHTKLLIRKMARLHGASMKYFEETKFQDVPDYYFVGMIKYTEDEKVRERLDPIFGRTMFINKVKEMAEDIQKRPGYENEANLLQDLAEHSHDLLCELYKYKPGKIFNAHLQGDCWVNNMLYKYDDSGKPIDVMMLDLQCAYINSIGNEFMYYFLSSASDSVRKSHYQDIVKYYHDNLVETLQKVGYQGVIPTLEQLHEELIASSIISLMVASFMLQVVKAELSSESKDRSKSETVSMEEVLKISDGNRGNVLYVNTLFHTIDLLKEIGTFEYLQNILKKFNTS